MTPVNSWHVTVSDEQRKRLRRGGLTDAQIDAAAAKVQIDFELAAAFYGDEWLLTHKEQLKQATLADPSIKSLFSAIDVVRTAQGKDPDQPC